MKVLSRFVKQILWNTEKRRQLHKLHEDLDCTDSAIFWFYVLTKFHVKMDESGQTFHHFMILDHILIIKKLFLGI